ncbi:phospholipase B1, membrane-associated-like [Osmerus mordax]|uniref:phospholipase B1, membrane-associated-like n=1 Tax=Osmerus mordax TaxID=8014 RepID=UPI00350F6214
MTSLCSPAPALPASSVHALRPADIAVVSTMGIPHSHGSLLEQAEDLALSFSNQTDRDWGLVLLFVPADSVCACSQQVLTQVESAVKEVEVALEVLLKKLHHSLVHVVVWSGLSDVPSHQDRSCLCMEEKAKQRLQRAVSTRALQESLDSVLRRQRRLSEREDFAVLLHASPVVTDPLILQLWTNLLQPMAGQTEVKDNDINSISCPTDEQPFLRTQLNSPSPHQERSSTNSREARPLIDPIMGSELPCTDRSPSPTVPTSVHELQPGDIKVVAALGDSLTAGNGVGAKDPNNLLLVMNEYRGLSWSIGGDHNLTTVTTLPNILKEFNPLLTGFSTGIGNEDSPKAFLNQAVPGATSSDMTTQARVLIDKMKNDSRVDFQNDWKLITMFIGGNDLCDFCTDSVYFSANNVVGRIREALDILHREVPRALVNLAELLHIVPLRQLHQDKSINCPTWFVNIVCPCVVKPNEGSRELQSLQDMNRAYQSKMRELVDTGRYDTHDNFTVVLQPFLREVYLPLLEDGRPDRSFFSPDCFHLSEKAHRLMASGIWNNMVEPVGNKTFSQDFSAGVALQCPSKTIPFLRTAHNSNYTYQGPPPSPPPITNWGSDFSCVNTAPSETVPTSVHRLKPGDIKVVAAVGDSLTAAFGAKAKNMLQLRTENRGVAWSIGGDETLQTVTTLPNILKKFNPNIQGMSKGDGKRQTGFNLAVSGAKISGIPGQIKNLIDAMKKNSAVDFQNDWKLVTLFIGGNDLCQYCNDRATLSPKNYSSHMMASLDLLYNEVPRVMVNVLGILEIIGLRRVKRDSLGCNLLQKNVCPCFIQPGEDSMELSEIKRINRELQTETENLIHSGRYDSREDFTVVLQPFFKNSVVPVNTEGKPDNTYFSVDCFHFSARGHADMAVALWNNMLEPVGQKQTYNNFTNDRNSIKCPTEEQPYIFTNINSLPAVPTTTTTTTTTTIQTPSTSTPLNPTCSDNVPVWAAAVLAVTGLLIGWGLTWVLLSCKEKRNRRKVKMVEEREMKGTGF